MLTVDTRMPGAAKLVAFYLSCDRVLSLVNTEGLPPQVLHALQGKDCMRCVGNAPS
jgi:hypothetical protein